MSLSVILNTDTTTIIIMERRHGSIAACPISEEVNSSICRGLRCALTLGI